jgi:restriction system protein
VLDLLPDSPQQAINVLDAYLDAHAWYMPDGRLAGLGDARAIIRAKYILVGDIENCERVMSQLASREFEVLLCELYKARGYRTRLTPPSKDGGFDVLAVKGGSGHREHCLVECKHHRNPVGVKDARALLQVVTQRRATKGVLVSSSKFTAGTRALAASNRQLDLVDRRALLKLLNQHLGANWPLTVDHLIAKEAQVRLRIPTHSITQSDRIRSWFRAFDQRSERSDEYGN